MGGTGEDVAEAEAGVPTDTGAMTMTTVTLAVVTAVEGMMIGILTMKVGARGVGAQVLAIGGDEVEVLVVGGTEAPSEKEVKRGVQKLSNGIGKRKKLIGPSHRLILVTTINDTIQDLCRMGSRTTDIISRTLSRRDMDIDLFLTWFVSFYLVIVWVPCKRLLIGMGQ